MVAVSQRQGETPTLRFNTATARRGGGEGGKASTEERDEIRREETRAENEVEAERAKPVGGTLRAFKDKRTLGNSISTRYSPRSTVVSY